MEVHRDLSRLVKREAHGARNKGHRVREDFFLTGTQDRMADEVRKANGTKCAGHMTTTLNSR